MRPVIVPSSLLLSLIASVATSSGAAGAAGGGDGPDLTPIFGRDNAAFARALARQGFGDLADAFCRKFDAWKDASPEEKASVRSVALDLAIEVARQQADPLQRKDAITAVLKQKEEFIAQYPTSPEAEEAELSLPDAYRTLGEALTAALEKTTDPTQSSKLRDEGRAAFNHAEDVLRARKKVLEKKLSDPLLSERETDAVRDQRASVWFNIARVEYFQSQLFAKEDPEFQRRVKSALRTLQDMVLEYEDKLVTYEAYVFTGLCDHALGANDQALADFDQGIALREQYVAGANGKYQIPLEIDDVVSWAVLQKVNALNDAGRSADVIATIKDYYAKSPQPDKALSGLQLLAIQADNELKSGDSKSAGETAQRLEDLDPNGPWGARGREVLAQMLGDSGAPGGKARSLGSVQLLKIADALNAKNDTEQALQVCVRALDAAAGDPDGSSDVLIYMGGIYGKVKDLPAAAVCFDTVWQQYPKAARAPEGLYRAIDVYVTINATERRPFYAGLIAERRNKLANEYPTSPLASKVQLLQGRTLESEQKFAEAADFFLKVQPGSPNYEEAQFNGSRCLVKEAQRLGKAKQVAEAKAMVARAETQIKQTMTLLRSAAEKTLDLSQRQIWDNQSFECRTLLANLFMLEGVGRAADVPKLLEGVEEQYKDDPDKIGRAWGLRIQAFSSIGQFDQAEKLLESLLVKDASSGVAAVAAGIFARTCDAKGFEMLSKDPKSKPGDEMWKKAFRYYTISTKPKLKDAAAARNGELEQIGNRFFVMGQHFNGIPDKVQSFVGWGGKITAPEYFEEAANLYSASLEFVQSDITRISQARALGFLGKFDRAGEVYEKIFEKDPIVDVTTGDVNKAKLKQRPELLTAYLELGVSLLKVGLPAKDADRLSRANQAFDLVVRNSKVQGSREPPSETWWTGRYWQIRAWVDVGQYKNASLALRDVERNTSPNFDEGKYGLQELFKKMKGELAGKVVDDQ
jgi:tetratricopeptide (TPR) repeat protein